MAIVLKLRCRHTTIPALTAEGSAPSLVDQLVHEALHVNHMATSESHLLGLIEDGTKTSWARQGARENDRPPQKRVRVRSPEKGVEVNPDTPDVTVTEAGASVYCTEVKESHVSSFENHVCGRRVTVYVLYDTRPTDDPNPKEAGSVGCLRIFDVHVSVPLLRRVPNLDEPQANNGGMLAQSSMNCVLKPCNDFFFHSGEDAALHVWCRFPFGPFPTVLRIVKRLNHSPRIRPP